MLACVAKPTRHPARDPSAAAVTMNAVAEMADAKRAKPSVTSSGGSSRV